MEPAGPNILAAAESARVSLAQSAAWAPSLTGSSAHPPALAIRALQADDFPYFIVELARAGTVTARFALDGEGILLEAEATKQLDGALQPWISAPPARDGSSDPAPLVWKPCDQSLSRLSPFYEVSGNNSKFLRIDGAAFKTLTALARG